MISDKLVKLINEQINKELYSEYLYLAMASHCDNLNLPGCVNFFIVQLQEERMHAMKFYAYLKDRRAKVVLKAIDEPPFDFGSVSDVFSYSLTHEKKVTESIGNIMTTAKELKDHSAEIFLQWFVTEQVEEEDSFDKIVSRLATFGSTGEALLSLDKELALRVFTPPPAQ